MSLGRASVVAGVVAVMVPGSTPVPAQTEDGPVPCVQAVEEDPPDPCGNAYGHFALLDCWAREVERADGEMNLAYRELLQKLPERGGESLKRSQELWLEFRAAHLGVLYGADDPEEVYGRDYRICVQIATVVLTRERTRELARLLERDVGTVCPL